MKKLKEKERMMSSKKITKEWKTKKNKRAKNEKIYFLKDNGFKKKREKKRYRMDG